MFVDFMTCIINLSSVLEKSQIRRHRHGAVAPSLVHALDFVSRWVQR